MTRRRAISSRVNDNLVAALLRTNCVARSDCKTCHGRRVIVQVSPEMHDAWAAELTRATGTQIAAIHQYGEFRVMQLPNLIAGTFQVRACWDCTEIPKFPDDPEAIARFLT